MRFEAGSQTISWFQKEYREGTIVLRPPYQRKPVWAARQKCYLVESILLGMPVPEIFIHETTDPEGRTIHAIVDGQQRIRAVLQFVGLNTSEPDEEEFTGFAIDKLDRHSRSPYLGRRFADLASDDRIRFFEYKFHIRYLYTPEESELRNMFARLNRYLTALSPQELRHATYVGPFPKLAEDLAEDEFWLKSGLVGRAMIRRLGDVDFVSQLLIGVIHGPEGGSAAVVDDYYRRYEDYDLDEGIPDQRRVRRLFEQTLTVIRQLFPNLQDAEVRWANRADFYSLFIALAQILRAHGAPTGRQLLDLATTLTQFSQDVDLRLSNQRAKVARGVAQYVRAVEKGVNDKARRADRHRVLTELIERRLGVEGSQIVAVGKKPRKRATE
jgi:hypothetical protein